MAGRRTIAAILRRHGRLDPAEAGRHAPWQRFERAHANELWQIDLKGHFALGLEALADEAAGGVAARLTALFRRHGLPRGDAGRQRRALGGVRRAGR